VILATTTAVSTRPIVTNNVTKLDKMPGATWMAITCGDGAQAA
jgi:hypothetical protein